MTSKKKVIAICGSTRQRSSNHNLIKAIAVLAAEKFDITEYTTLDRLPHFNPDLDNESSPREITDFRNKLREFDGILICTPEYAMGVPGTLKNAIDWTVSSMEFSNRPTALVTASSMGENGHEALMKTLRIIEARITDETQLVISHIRTKINDSCEITDTDTLALVKNLIGSFSAMLREIAAS